LALAVITAVMGGPARATDDAARPDGAVKQARTATPPDTADATAPPGTGVSSTPPPALTEFEQRARTEFERAQRAYDLGRFEEAIVHYSRAYEALALPPFLFNIAQCHRLLGEYAQAAFFYRRYLDLAGNPPNAALARELLGEMEQRQSDHERLERETGARVRAALMAHPEPPEDLEPLYRRWWFWAAVGGVVAGVTAVTVASSQPSRTTLGTLDSR
jgi:tetratricopeptide (TPR) repeat protein